MSISEITSLQNYASNLLQNVVNNYEKKIDRWRTPLDQLATAFKLAHVEVSKTTKAHIEEKQKRRDLGFAVLQMVAGHALGWVVLGVKSTNPYKTYVFGGTDTADPIKELFLGNIFDAVKWSGDQGLSALKSGFKVKMPKIDSDPDQFKTDLMSNFRYMKDPVRNLFLNKDTSILWGEKGESFILMNFMLTKDYTTAKRAIEQWVTQLEKKWCPTVRYYREAPNFPPQIVMQRIFERAMMAQWIKTHIKTRRTAAHNNLIVSQNTNDVIETKLVALGIMRPDSSADRAKIQQAKKKIKRETIIHGSSKPVGVKKDLERIPTLSNPGWWTSDEETEKIVKWAKSFKSTRIGDFTGSLRIQ